MTRPRLLWVTEEVPDRAGGGGSIRQANLLIDLATRFEICLLVAGSLHDAAVRGAVAEVVEVLPVATRHGVVPPRLRTTWDLWGRGRGLNVAGSMPALRALGPALGPLRRHQDIVVLNHENLLPLLPTGRHPAELLVAHLFDVKSLVAQQAASVAATRRQAAMWGADARVMRRLEVEALRTVDLVVTCSHEDQAALDRIRPRRARAQALVVPNGVDLDRFAPTPAPRAQRVLFFGSLDYVPNVDGVRWFARDVWPLVHGEVPGATLSVVGRRPVPDVLALASLPGVEVVGDVPDAPPWFSHCDVVVVPLRIGTGTRLKALEAMACGRPVVGTSIGLEGLGLDRLAEPGAARVVDDASAMAAAVIDLVRNPDAARRDGEAGRRHVEERFGWAPIARAMADGLHAALDATRSGVDR